MTSLRFALYLTCLFLWRIGLATDLKLSTSVHQESRFISANVGDNVTLKCFYKGDVAAMFYWYKQTLGQKPRLVSSYYKHDKHGTFTEEFKNNTRFSLDTKDDSATYYCISCYAYKFEFGEGATLSSLDSRVYFLSGALAFTTILSVLLVFSLYTMNKRNSCQCTESQARFSVPSTANAEGYQDADHLHYAALRHHRVNRTRRQKDDTSSQCVYSTIRQ
uniref:Ig-like domain-containing protein n=1 Tax=Lates calcarifer TaxID=8187 RepID=A0A4W6DHL8_LATCA